jgi:hypothetical protein
MMSSLACTKINNLFQDSAQSFPDRYRSAGDCCPARGIQPDLDHTPRPEAWYAVSVFFFSFFCQYCARRQWAEPVTGSSFTPTEGAKNQLTKSNPCVEARDVTMTPRMGILERPEKSGAIFRTSCSDNTSMRLPNRFFPVQPGCIPCAWLIQSRCGFFRNGRKILFYKISFLLGSMCPACPEKMSRICLPKIPFLPTDMAAVSVAYPQVSILVREA